MLGSLCLRYFLCPPVRMENSMESWAEEVSETQTTRAEEVSETQTTKHHAMSSKLKLFPPCNRLHTIPCSHLMSFGLKPRTTTNKICSSCQIFFKAFLETVNYAGFCGILNTTQTP